MASPSKHSGYADNWQAGKTVTECNLHMLTTEDCSDVIFRVGSEKHVVRAHRYVLVSRSCVFHAMFCGPLAEQGEVTIPDIEANIFKVFLRYLYSDAVDVTADNVTGLLYTSKKYAVDGLEKQCVTYLENSLTDQTVCTILEETHIYCETDLETKALKMLSEAGTSLTESEGFKMLCSDCFGTFLKSDDIRLSEEDVFLAALSWAEAECAKQEIEPSPENVREALADLRHEIRFTELSQSFLVKIVGPSGILSSEERLLIMDGIACTDVDITPFKSSPRKGSQTIIHRFTKHNSYQWGYSNEKPEAISFSVSTHMKLLGFQLYGPFDGHNAVYSIKGNVYDGNVEVRDCHLPLRQYTLCGQEMKNNILLPKPLKLKPGNKYTIVVGLRGTRSLSGAGGLESVEQSGVAVTFFDSSLSQNGTSVSSGQIPGLILQ